MYSQTSKITGDEKEGRLFILYSQTPKITGDRKTGRFLFCMAKLQRLLI